MFSRFPQQISEIFKPLYSPFLHIAGYFYPLVIAHRNNVSISQRPCFPACWENQALQIKVLLEKVKYLELTHKQPQGNSEKAKTPPRCKHKKKKRKKKSILHHIYFSSCPSIPYGPNAKIKWTLQEHKYFTNLKINLKANLSFL